MGMYEKHQPNHWASNEQYGILGYSVFDARQQMLKSPVFLSLRYFTFDVFWVTIIYLPKRLYSLQ